MTCNGCASCSSESPQELLTTATFGLFSLVLCRYDEKI